MSVGYYASVIGTAVVVTKPYYHIVLDTANKAHVPVSVYAYHDVQRYLKNNRPVTAYVSENNLTFIHVG